MSQPATHYDTTRLPAQELRAAQAAAANQERRALDWFRAHPGRSFSRDELEAALNITTQAGSRVLANLTSKGLLEKSPTAHVIGKHRARVHTWRLVRREMEQGRLL